MAAARAAAAGVRPENHSSGTEVSVRILEEAVLNQEAVGSREASGACA